MKTRQPFGYGGMLLLLFILPACSRDRDVPEPARVTQIEFKENLMTVDVGKSAELKVFHSPAELSPPDYEWSVSDTNAARVENGRVYGLKAGETEVSVLARRPGLTARIKIRVVPVLPQALRLQAEKTSLFPGEETQITYAVDPPDVTDPDKLEIEWSGSDETVCRVSQGKVVALGAGTAEVVARVKGTAIKGSLIITVNPVQVQRIVLSTTSGLSLVMGQEHTLTATVLPEQAKDKSLKWNSSNISVATVDLQGRIVAKGKGTAIIWAISVSNPRVQASCQVVVVNQEDMVFTQMTATSRVSVNGYVSVNLSGLIENGFSSPIELISFEVRSHAGEVVVGDYRAAVVSPGMQYRHTAVIKNVFRPYIRYVFILNGNRFERRLEI